MLEAEVQPPPINCCREGHRGNSNDKTALGPHRAGREPGDSEGTELQTAAEHGAEPKQGNDTKSQRDSAARVQ